MASQTTSLTATNKLATVAPTKARTETPKPVTDDRVATLEAASKAVTVDPMTTPTAAKNKVAMVNLTIAHPETLKAGTDDRKTLMATRSRATGDRTTHTETTEVEPITNRMEAPRAVMDDQTILMGATKVAVVGGLTTDLMITPRVAMVGLRAKRTKPPRAATDSLTTTTGEIVVVMGNRMTTATVERKIPTGEAPPAMVDRMMPLLELL
jgi:hypothetical protein